MKKISLVLVCGRVVGGHEIQLKTILEDACELRDDLVIVCQTAATQAFFSTLPCTVECANFGVEGKVWHQWRLAPVIARQLASYFARAKSLLVSGGTIEACIGTIRAAKLAKPDLQVLGYVPMYIDRSLTHGVVGSIYNRLVDHMAGVADRYLTINRIQANLLGRHYGRPVQVLENTIQVVREPTESRGKRLVYLGRYDDGQKGLGELVEMLDSAQNPYRDLYLIGDGPDKAALAMRATTARHIKVHFMPWMSVSEVDAFIGVDDVLVMNSRWEGEPLVVREFSARKLPCVVRDITGMRGVSRKSLRFSDSATLIAALRRIYGETERSSILQSKRLPQARRREIIAACFEEF